MYQRGPQRGAGGSKASPVGGFSARSGLRNYHELRIKQSRVSLELSIKTKPSVTQHVPFFSENQDGYRDEAGRKKVQRSQTRGKAPLSILQLQDNI